MCSGSEAGWYLRLIEFVYHSTLGWRVIKKKRRYARCQRLQARTQVLRRAMREFIDYKTSMM